MGSPFPYNHFHTKCNTGAPLKGTIRMGKRLTVAFVLISTSFLGQFSAPAQASGKCPLKLSHLDLRYRHTGGTSRPQLDLSFTNVAENKITRITFNLSILDSGGYPHPY